MSAEEQLFAVFDDLEQQASSLFAEEREIEVRDRARAEYAQVSLMSRLVASLGQDVALEVRGVGRVTGRLAGAGAGKGGAWCALGAGPTDWVVATDAVEVAYGTSQRSVPEVAWGPAQRLGLGAVLRRLSDAGTTVVAHLRSGARVEGVVVRVGQDFAELLAPGGTVLLSLTSVAALSSAGLPD